MLQIQDTLVSLDLIERFFCCDLDACLGACCVEGDAGAPLNIEEVERIEESMPEAWADLTPAAKETINDQGVAYVDEEGDLVTSIVNGRDCVFCTYAPGGKTLCALEKAYREGRTKWCKPASCRLLSSQTQAIRRIHSRQSSHMENMQERGDTRGRKLGIRAYQFLKDPLSARFGEKWYEELCITADEYLRRYGERNDAS